MTDIDTSAAAEIIDTPNPQNVSFNPEPAAPEVNPVEAAMAEMEKDGAKFGDEADAPEPEVKEKEAKPAKTAKEPEVEAVEDEPEPEPDPAELEGDDDDDDARKSDIDKPPSRFLPRAKEKWAGVDADVRGEVYRALSEMERGLEQSREDREFRKGLRQYEDMTRQAGTDIPRVLSEYVDVYNHLRTDPAGAVQRLLATVGVTPEQYVQHVMGQAQQQQANPQAYAQSQQTQALQGQIQALQQQIQSLTQGNERDREAARISEIERSVIAPFRAEHPRYDELQGDIVFFLNSDKIPSTLNERQRLEAAYDMAERINPAPSGAAERVNSANQRPLNPAGKKSVKGAPNGVKSAPSANLNGKEAIEHAMRQMGL